MASLRRSLAIGSNVFYPEHGVARVLGVEERSFGAEVELFYTLQLERGDRVLLPVSKLEGSGIRKLVSVKDAKRLLAQMSSAPPSEPRRSRNERVAGYVQDLRTGSADRYTHVLQELVSMARASKLAADERRAHDVARRYFVSEIGTVLGMSSDEVTCALAVS